MPELPEVQTVVNSLQKLKNNHITSFTFDWEKVIYNMPPLKAQNIIKNKKITSISRKGKYIIIEAENIFLLCHLRMTGYLYMSNSLPKNKKHMRCYFNLNSNQYLIFEDIRKFGGFYIYKNLNRINTKLGIDPFDKNFTKKWLLNMLKSKRRIIKNLLLDQSIICGLGNIYIDEILWYSHIKPTRLSHRISKNKIYLLYQNTIDILNTSIKFHGTTILNFKFDNMKTGEYKNNLKVYGRANLPCLKCKTLIMKTKVAGRSTHYCKNCQD